MSKPRLTKPQIRQLAEEVVDRLLEKHGVETVGVIRQVLAERRVPKPPGRRVEQIWPILLDMTRLIIASGSERYAKTAARKVAHRIEGVALETAIDRLRTNYRKYRPQLEAEIANEAAEAGEETRTSEEDRRSSIIERAFEEQVDMWDL